MLRAVYLMFCEERKQKYTLILSLIFLQANMCIPFMYNELRMIKWNLEYRWNNGNYSIFSFVIVFMILLALMW